MKPRILIVGRGRVGGSLARAWKAAGYRVELRAHDFKRRINADVAVLAVPDRHLAKVAVHWAGRLALKTLVVHTAGALGLEPLSVLAEAGMRTGSLHPLLAIASPKTPLVGGWAAIDANPRDSVVLRRLARDAGLVPLGKSVRDRSHYHLGASLAANSQPVLLELACRQLVASGLPSAQARPALAVLARSAIDAWAQNGGPAGLTGPIARGDAATVRRHLATLSDETNRALYLALARAAMKLAARRRPVPDGLAEVARVLT